MEVRLRRERIQTAHGSGVGIRVPCRNHHRLFLRRRTFKAGRLRLVRQKLGRTSPACRPETIQSVGSLDRKSTRLNSSHLVISYAVFCLKKKKQNLKNPIGFESHPLRQHLQARVTRSPSVSSSQRVLL